MKVAAVCLICLTLPTLLASPSAPAPKPLAFTHISVIDGTGARTRSDQTVVITGDRITAMGSTETLKLPAGVVRVDATGKFLMPGLWDMHVHIGSGSRFYLPLFIANGVTGVRIMSGLPTHHQWRGEIDSGASVGPRMVIGSAVLDGPKSFFTEHVKAGSEAEAREAVQRAKDEGAEFIKVHDLVPRDAYFAILAEARKQGLPVAGHIPTAITPEEAATAGQTTVEHLTQLDSGSLADAGSRQAALFRLFKKHGTWQCPTLVMTRNYAWLDDPNVTSDSRLKYVRPTVGAGWKRFYDPSLPSREWTGRKQVFRTKQRVVAAMQRVGIGILAGTDLGNPYCFPGSSLADELALLVEAGLKPMEALQAATRNPARLLGREGDLGTVRTGKRADLLLLDGDPLRDIRNLRRIYAVVAAGRFYDRARLDRMLAEAEAAAAR
jgi:imidazolonepropionase-like amidohydrolase